MTCAWKELLLVLPMWMRQDVDRLGKGSMQELRLRINSPPEVRCSDKSCYLAQNVTREDLHYIVNAASKYSPWSAATSAQGYITAQGGHRIGLCGESVNHRGDISGIHNVSSLCIRVARDFLGIGAGAEKLPGSILILGAPGWGKTTLLRDVIRQIGQKEPVCVVDERGELFPDGIPRGKQVDILTGCPKRAGVLMLLRTMSPSCIAVDEITDPEDCQALIQAANCGVRLLATAHGSSVSDLRKRSVYRPLLDNQIFDTVYVLKRDKSYAMERMTQWDTNGSERL